jgi:pimeloyl-ACP methyl ester carboxylesterase
VKGGIIAGAVAAAAALASGVVVADRRVRATRRPAIAGLADFTAPDPDRAGYLRADDGLQLYYEQDGPLDAPVTVVLVHGFCQDRNDLLFQRRALLAEFGARIRIISVDLRSHGRSERSDTEHATIDQLGADLFTAIDELAPDGPVVLIGHSLGGMTIMALADRHPELFGGRIDGVALISTSTGKLAWLTLGVPAAVARVGDPAVRLALRGVRRQTRLIERGRARVTDAAWVFVRHLAFGPDVDPALVEFMTQMIWATPVDVIADFFPSFTSHDKLAALDALVDIPVVIVCGEDDLVTPPDHSRTMAEHLPKAELLLVPGTGHQVLMERPDLVDPALVRLVGGALDGKR